ncbi:hypothetical protein KY290_015373 [Solanum tuberosum]|uniref:Uncharacterized protein n=1 Tax=Solanum tuberosum TaxID=4113 RepID=A0ABQ7VV02_SOLTU|nr:hypothetical protein KY289_014980 [Solanum tuberosum]KAH0771392.1 hypothetical protein KY290_015373 [Solanum tuberosum]
MINEDNGSDIEAQGSSPLLMNSVNSTLIMRRLALILRSTYKFIEAGARIPSLSRVSSSSLSSTTTFYTHLPSFNLKHGDAEGGEDEIQVVEIVADDNTVQSNNDHIDIDQSTHQQCLQISEEIVKEQKLDWSDIHDVDKGIHVGDNSGHHMLIFTGYMIRQLVCKEPTIFLLAIAAILSFAFGIKEEGVQNGWFEGALLVVIIIVTVLFKFARNWYKRHLWKKHKDNKERKNYPLLLSETDSSFCACFDKLNNYIHISGLLIGILITVVVFIRFKLGNKDDEYGYRLETKEEAEIAQIMNALKKVLTESKGTERVLITLLGVTLVGMTEGVPFLISITMAYWYPNFDVKMESVSTFCIENVGWLKEQKLEVSQFFLDKKNVTKIPPDVCSVLFDGICVSTLTSQTTDQRMEEPILCWAEKNMVCRETL